MHKRLAFISTAVAVLFVLAFSSAYAYHGPKKRIAVSKFENKVRGVYGSRNLGEGFAEMLTTELMKTGRFIVIERQALQDIVSEQELGQTGLVRKETAAKVGQVLGAQILVRGVVSEFDMQKAGGGGGIGIGGFRLGLKGGSAHVAVDIRLIDSVTGQVLHSHNAAGTARSTGVGIGITSGDIDFDSAGFQKTPLGQATRQAIHDCIEFIISKMEHVPFSAKVIKVSGSKIYLNAGATMSIKPGDKFYAYSKGEEIIDPDTGLNLGSEEALVGTVEVTDVKDKFSIGVLKSGTGMLKRGDILKFQ
jgi:curli biogenesis system outer membrane secretion channel CsgG